MRDPYLYDDVPVLRNKAGIKIQEQLDKFEYDITFVNLMSIDNCLDINKKIDFNYLKKLHKYIFGDIYEWAGDIRSVPIAKAEVILGGATIYYSSPSEIEKDANKIISEMNKIHWGNMSHEEIADKFSRCIAALWQVHPFREGNTRTTMIFASHYAEQNGFYMDRNVFLDNSNHTRNSLVKASDGMYSEHRFLSTLILKAINQGVKVKCALEIMKANYYPTDALIVKMIALNNHLKKNLTVEEIRDMYKNISKYDPETSNLIKDAANEFKAEERRLNQPNIVNKSIEFEL